MVGRNVVAIAFGLLAMHFLGVIPLQAQQTQRQRWIGHRYYKDKGNGWGWVKRDGQKWKDAIWVAMKENPNDGIVQPVRRMGNDRGLDHNHQYVLYGQMAGYKAYCPTLDEMLEVFILQGYEKLGYTSVPDGLKPGPKERKAGRFRSDPRRSSLRY